MLKLMSVRIVYLYLTFVSLTNVAFSSYKDLVPYFYHYHNKNY